MRRCRHQGWLDVVPPQGKADGTLSFHVSNRFDQVVGELPGAATQEPSLVMMIGEKHKNAAMRVLLAPRTAREPTARDADIQLVLDDRTAFDDRPVVYVDVSANLSQRGKSGGLLPAAECHQSRHLQTTGDADPIVKSNISPIDLVASRLLAPFTDVICVFLPDFPHLEAWWARLATWIHLGAASTLPLAIRPHLLLVRAGGLGRAQSAAEVVRSLSNPEFAHFKQVFSGVTTIDLDDGGPPLGVAARYRSLQQEILHQSRRSRVARLETRTMFSSRRLVAFFRRALDHFCDKPCHPFDFIHASRIHHRVPDDLAVSVEEYLRGFPSLTGLVGLALPVLATSLLRNHYVPDMHLFDPAQVFVRLYADACRVALDRSSSCRDALGLPTASLLDLVQRKFVSLFKGLATGAEDAVTLHRRYLRRLREHWRKVYSARTCFLCLMVRQPEHRLACGHRICQTCVLAEGEPVPMDPCTYVIAHCPLCGMPTAAQGIGTVPPWTGLRVGSFDGGGCRGVIPLEFFAALERRSKIPWIGHRAFDVVLGSSSGGIDCEGIFGRGWSVRECQERFLATATEVFAPPAIAPLQPLPNLRRALLSCLSDSLYPASAIDRALQIAFGRETVIDEEDSFAAVHGIKYALTATTVPENRRLLITNYNGYGVRARNCDYEPIRNPDRARGLRTWEGIRSSTAAPPFFPHHQMEGTDSVLVDGGFFRNNPGYEALHESWAISSARRDVAYSAFRPDYISSFGTGRDAGLNPEAPPDPCLTGDRWRDYRRAWTEGSIGQICGFLKKQLDGHTTWQEFQTANPGLVNLGLCFRFDVDVGSRLPRLDSARSMRALQEAARTTFENSPELEDFAAMAVRKMMYLHPLDAFLDETGTYVLTGEVRCRWTTGQRGCDAFRRQFKAANPSLVVQGSSAGTVRLDNDGNLWCPVQVRVKDLSLPVSVQLSSSKWPLGHISNSPFDLAWGWTDVYFRRTLGDPVGRKRRGRSPNSRAGKRLKASN